MLFRSVVADAYAAASSSVTTLPRSNPVNTPWAKAPLKLPTGVAIAKDFRFTIII